MGSTVRWWDDPDAVEHLLAGVFEGGGAKGVAYVGALEATLEKRCWFGAVAGASAGAITAALVACGLTPERVAEESAVAFERLRPASLKTGLKQLRLNFGFLDNEGVRDWLETLLKGQATQFGLDVPGAVTFATLYAATEIELNVVAADLSRGRQIVFSVWDTPAVQVVDAVLASSSIPFAFAARDLRVLDGEKAYVHTVVDGGVWANFPTFVFSDASFRKSFGRPELIAEDYAVGYLLDEQGAGDPDIRDSFFVSGDHSVDAREWRLTEGVSQGEPPSLPRRLVAGSAVLLLSPLWVLLRLGAWLSLGDDRAWRGRWPPTTSFARWPLSMFNDALSALHSAWLGGLSALGVIGGAAAAIYWLVTSFLLLRLDEMRFDVVFGLKGAVLSEVIQIVLVTIAIGLIVTVAITVLASLAANYLMLGPARQVLAGIVKTYTAGSGAPMWAGVAENDHVIRLPIPPLLTTLAFDRNDPTVKDAIDRAVQEARVVTAEALEVVLRHEPIDGPARDPAPPPIEGGVAESRSSSRARGPILALRLSLLSLAITALVLLLGWLIPDPAWYRYDVNVRVCGQAIETPNDPCTAPGPDLLNATVLFGPLSAGHDTQATMSVNGRVVERSPLTKNTANGRILNLPIDSYQLCGLNPCGLEITAFVDGKEVFSQRIELKTSLDINRG